MKPGSVFSSVNKKVLVLIGGSALLLSIIISTVLVIRYYRLDSSIKASEEQKMAYNTDKLIESAKINNNCDLIYPEVIEELDLSVDPYRSPNFKWSEKEVSRLWQEPDAADIDYFTEANHKLVWDILKDAP